MQYIIPVSDCRKQTTVEAKSIDALKAKSTPARTFQLKNKSRDSSESGTITRIDSLFHHHLA